jgi:hypothetical protein
MANIPLPQRGQPIDFNYIYQIVSAVNTISTQVVNQSKNININTDSGSQNVDVAHLGIDATYFNVNATSESVDAPVSGSYTFKTSFKVPPIVTITPYAKTQSAVNYDAIVVITEVTQTDVKFKVTFPNASKKSKGSISVYLTAIGIAQSIN